MKSKTLREDRTAAERKSAAAAEWKNVAKATRRRRRILQAGFFFIYTPSRLSFQQLISGKPRIFLHFLMNFPMNSPLAL